MKKNNEKEIIIVGGSLSGISTWLHLHKKSPELAEKVILIEKCRYPREKLCGGAAGGWSEEVLKYLNVKVDVPSVWIDQVDYILENDTFRYKQKNFFRIVNRSEFDYAFAKNAINRGLTINQNESIINHIIKNNQVKIKTNKKNYSANILIGADGALSTVRKNMKNKIQPRYATGIEVYSKINYKYENEHDKKTAVLDFSYLKKGLQGYIWHFPYLENNKPMMNHGILDTNFFRNKPRSDLKKLLTKELSKRNIDMNDKQLKGHPITWYDQNPVHSQKNTILVGDAAGIEPLLGGGIHLALSYGDIASNAIIDAYENNEFTFKDYSNRISNHIVGKYISKFTYLASKLYNNELDIVEVLQKTLSK